MKTKRCTKCKKIKSVEEFHKNSCRPDGLQKWCRSCWTKYDHKRQKQRNIYRKERYHNNFDIRRNVRRSVDQCHSGCLINALCFYSPNGNPRVVMCARCGRTDIDILVFDHIDDNGGTMRRKDGTRLGGYQLAYWLKAHNYPIGIQILCFNCNRKKEAERRSERARLNNAQKSERRRRINKWNGEWNRLLRLEAFQHYGPNNEAKCAICGESDYDVLDLDHINGRGERKTLFEILGGAHLAIWLKQNSWPDVPLQVLCQNCNHQKHHIEHSARRGGSQERQTEV